MPIAWCLVLIAVLGDLTSAKELPAISTESIRALIEEIAPIVEKHAGRKFQTVPAVRLVEVAQMEELLFSDTDLVMEYLGIDLLQDLDMSVQIAMAIPVAAQSLLGKYSLKSKEIAVSPNALRAATSKHGLSSAQAEDLLRMTIAHEMVHALCDQAIDYATVMKRLAGSKTKQKLFPAFNEGFACVLTRLMAADLQIDDSLEALEPIYFDSPVAGREYKGGTSMMTSLHKKFGVDGMWEMLRDPMHFEAEAAAETGDRYSRSLALDAVAKLLPCASPKRVDMPADLALNFFQSLGASQRGRISETTGRVYSATCLGRPSETRPETVSVAIYVAKEGQTTKALCEAIPAAWIEFEKFLKSVGTVAMDPLTTLSEQPQKLHRTKGRWLRPDGELPLYMAWFCTDAATVQVLALGVGMNDGNVVAALTSISESLSTGD